MPDILEALRTAKKWLDLHYTPGQSISEENTKAGLIEPILTALGWNVHDPDEVDHEYRYKPSDNPVDYALRLRRGTPRALVEAKGVAKNLDDPKWAKQTLGYAMDAGVEWVVLTNGVEWRIYNSHATVPVDQKLFRTVKLGDEETDHVAAVLDLLSKENMGGDLIEEQWNAYFVDRRVKQALVILFDQSEPASELVRAIRHRTSALSLKEVRDSLKRLRLPIFEFPAVDGPLAGAAIDGAKSAAKARKRGPAIHLGVTAAEGKLKTIDLLAKGLLAAGATLHSTLPDGQKVMATVRPDGWIDYAGTSYKTPSGAGGAVRRQFPGHRRTSNTDGWSFWYAEDANGKPVRLKELRRSAAAHP